MIMRQIAQILAALAFVTLALVPSMASAATCKGKDLLKQLEAEDPRRSPALWARPGAP